MSHKLVTTVIDIVRNMIVRYEKYSSTKVSPVYYLGSRAKEALPKDAKLKTSNIIKTRQRHHILPPPPDSRVGGEAF